MKKQRKHFTPEEKVAVLRRHLLKGRSRGSRSSAMKLGLQPMVFYRWQKEFFENDAAAFEQRVRLNYSANQERIAPPGEEDPDQGRSSGRACGPKKSLGNSDRVWVPHDTRKPDRTFRKALVGEAEISAGQSIEWLDITASKFYD